MVIGQTIQHRSLEHGTHRAVAAVHQLFDEDRFLCLPVLEELSERVKMDPKLVGTARTRTQSKDIPKSLTHSFRYLQIITATFSQFFLVGQKTRHECVGMTSVTRAMM